MKLKKVLALALSAALTLSIAGCGNGATTAEDNSAQATGTEETKAAEGTEEAAEKVSTEGVTITILNTTSGLEKFFEPAMEEYYNNTGVTVEWMSINEGDSPYEALQKLYAAGQTPTLAIMDCNDIIELGPEKALPLDGEDWVAVGGETYGVKVDDVLYSFPFSLQGRGILFNRTVIESTLGRDFDESSIKTLDDFIAICDELQAAGLEYPTCISKEDWSLGAHYMGLVFEQQGTQTDVTNSGDAFKASLIDGSASMADNARFNSIMDTFDVLMKYNINGADPLAADYELDNSYFAEGDVAFWFNGNWVEETVAGYADENTEFGMIPVVQDTENDAFNEMVNAVASKQIMIDKEAGEAEIQAAKDFLNWLVYDETAQDIIANQGMLIPSFTTFDANEGNKLGMALKSYVDAGKTFDQYNGLPGDHWANVGASMQKYLGGQCSREELAAAIDSYWQSQEK